MTPAATRAQRQLGEARDPLAGRLQCLRCGHEFKPEAPRLGLDSEEGWKPLFQKAGKDRPCPHASCLFRDNGFEVGSVGGSPRDRRSGDHLFCLEEKIKPSACYVYKKKRRMKLRPFLFSLKVGKYHLCSCLNVLIIFALLEGSFSVFWLIFQKLRNPPEPFLQCQVALLPPEHVWLLSEMLWGLAWPVLPWLTLGAAWYRAVPRGLSAHCVL